MKTNNLILASFFLLALVVSSTLSQTNKPTRKTWVQNSQNREFFLRWLIDGCSPGDPCSRDADHPHPVENGGLDGFYNNPYRPELGAIDSPLLRRTPAAYADGVLKPSGEDRPNPLELSEQLMSGEPGTTSKTGKTALLVFFGQQLVEEVLDAQKPSCPPEYFNIKIPLNHTYRHSTGLDELPFLRSRYASDTGIGPNNPRQQLNEITPYMDGNLVYGTSPTWTDLLRHFANGSVAPRGQLAWSDPEGRFPEKNVVQLPMFNPPPPSRHSEFTKTHQTLKAARHFMLGNPRGNENPMLLSFGVLWFRWHNAIARYLGKSRPRWSDDRVFHETKKWVVATYQHLAINKWLPEWIGERLPPYERYDPTATPQIDQLFQTAAMRFGHTLVTSGVYLRDYSRNGCDPIPFTIVREQLSGESTERHGAGVRTCNSFWRPQDILLADAPGSNKDVMDIDRLLMGMSSQLAEREDHIIVQDLRGFVFGPMEFPRRDLMAVNIQRGRDHGVPDYNTARASMGLKRITSFDTFVNETGTAVHQHDDQVIRRMANLYKNDINNVDLWVGGLLETNRGPGQLFKSVLKDQFKRIRDSDRFWYRNFDNGLFTLEEVQRLEQISMYEVIMSVTRMEANDIQENPFLSPSEDLPGQTLSDVCMEKLVPIPQTCTRHGELENSTERRFTCKAFPQQGSREKPLESCTPPSTYSYFSGSETSYFASVLVLVIVVAACPLALIFLLKRSQKVDLKKRKAYSRRQLKKSLKLSGVKQDGVLTLTALEWISRQEERLVSLVFYCRLKKIEVRNESAVVLRTIDLSREQPFWLSRASDAYTACLKFPSEYDLVMRFNSENKNEQFMNVWNAFMRDSGLKPQSNPNPFVPEKSILSQAVTCEHRRQRLQLFLKSAFSQEGDGGDMITSDAFLTELTREEFASELRMTPDSPFVDKIFKIVDKDNNGYISFREFRDLLVVFSKEDADAKLQFLFNMYDHRKGGKLSNDEFFSMVNSLVELSSGDIKEEEISNTVKGMLSSVQRRNKDEISFDEFKTVFGSHRQTIGAMELGFAGQNVPRQFQSRPGVSSTAQQRKGVKTDERGEIAEQDKSETLRKHHAARELSAETFATQPEALPGLIHLILRRLDHWRLEVFWMVLFTLILLGVFAERVYTYAVEREHIGLRRATGAGIPITRGAASGMMLCFSVLLLAPCRHITTWLRETPVVRYVPLDSAIPFHQYVAWWGIFFAGLHTVGHLFNFYNIATQPAQDLACIFREQFFPTHVMPKFHHWVWTTLTGFTGVLLVPHSAAIFFFSLPPVRRRLYLAFWWTHKTYPVFYILILLHGAARLVQEPYFPYFLVGPAVLFVVDHLVSVSRRRVLVSILDAELLPSNVTKLEIARPQDFEFRSGQWIRISCPSLGDSVFHPFTLSSAPQSSTLSLHIRAVGPWTTRLRHAMEQSINNIEPYPQLYLDGPYGEGHQDWCKYEVAVLIGGGIGVTPFASILQDIVSRINGSDAGANKLPLKKIYFLWVTRDQKQFEWFVDLLREVESKDSKELIANHIFITQFFQKFDIRTIMLYVCERYFQQVSRRSLFTGLRAVTHFGHPQFGSILQPLKAIHPEVQKFGVFSCGPRTMTRAIDSACHSVNVQGNVDFRHHFENY